MSGGIKREPFRLYNDEEKIAARKEKRDHISVSISKEDKEWLNAGKRILQQPKNSTAIKQLAQIGAIVIQDNKTRQIIELIKDNKRRNKRTGADEFQQM
jgi:beta-lactam-binding protein with PASTA domain